MSDTDSLEGLGRGIQVTAQVAEAAPLSLAGRRGLRVALLSLAAAILLLGAATAGVFGYLTFGQGTLAGALPGGEQLERVPADTDRRRAGAVR